MKNKTIIFVFATIVMMLIPITIFAESKDNAIMELTRQGIPISEKSLETFIEKGDIRVVNLLIDAGLSPNSKCADGYPILSFAALTGKTDIAKSLIARGANVNAEGPRTGRNPSGYNAGGTPIFFAAMTGNTDILKLLIAEGADVNSKMTVGMTPLMFAASNGHLNAVKILISNGADLNAKTNNGKSVLDLAGQYPQIIKILKEAGAK
jgi:ankyrin repeat protein